MEAKVFEEKRAEKLAESGVTQKFRVVLARFQGGFVTWELNVESGLTYWGHYFTDRGEAERDFIKRSLELREMR